MKHIKKYNESNNFIEIKEIVKEAFIDFLDTNSAYIEFFDNEKQIFISIDIEKW
jgi:hypothetical protein